jgi:hypothetical protein
MKLASASHVSSNLRLLSALFAVGVFSASLLGCRAKPATSDAQNAPSDEDVKISSVWINNYNNTLLCFFYLKSAPENNRTFIVGHTHRADLSVSTWFQDEVSIKRQGNKDIANHKLTELTPVEMRKKKKNGADVVFHAKGENILNTYDRYACNPKISGWPYAADPDSSIYCRVNNHMTEYLMETCWRAWRRESSSDPHFNPPRAGDFDL